MKCQRIGCYKEAVKGGKYCSKEHAPYSHLDNQESRTKSALRMDSSSIKGCGAVLNPSCADGAITKQKSSLLNVVPAVEKSNERTTTGTSKPAAASAEKPGQDSQNMSENGSQNHGWSEEILKKNESFGRPGMIEQKKNIAEKSESVASVATLPTESPQLSTISNTGESHSMSLIDSSTQHLLELMQSIKVTSEKLDPQAINAACNCAKNIRELIGLKLAVYRTSKKL